MRNVIALFALLFLTLAGCNEPEDETCTSCQKVSQLVTQGKKEIGAGNFSEAVQLCEDALEVDAASSDARYCIVIARMGKLSLALNTILARAGAQLPSDPILYSPSLDYKQIIKGIVQDLEIEMAAMDEQFYELAKVEDLQFQIPLFPIHLKFQRLAEFYNTNFDDVTGYQLPGELIFNAGGTWDRSEILALGALFNTALAALDYALAHDFNLAKIPASSNIFEMFAEMFVINPDLLRFVPNEESRSRLRGGADDKGLTNDVIAVFSYVSGRETDLAPAAPANPGLKAAFAESAALAATDAVLVWIDEDADGHPEAVESEIFGEVSEQLTGIRLARLPTVFSPETMDALYSLGTAMLGNIEAGEEPVAINALLEAVRADVGGLTGIDSIAHKPVPDFVRLSPGSFLAEPLPLRHWLPLLYTDESGYSYSNATYGMLYDWETIGWDTPQNRYYSFSYHGWDTSYDLDHFTNLPDEAFAEFTPLSGVALSDDGVNPNASVTSLLYVALQNPSFGGLLHLDPSALGGASELAAASNQSLNESVARLMKYYCFDFGYDYGSIYPTFRDSCPEGSENE